MCGIVGCIGKNLENNQGNASLESIAHRGPNDSGNFYDTQNQVFLGQRRLSIIDLSKDGHQPFFSQDERYVLVFNGEIYNYIELKTELEPHYTFHTKTDTEVLLAAYIHWGEKCLQKLNGMFAFAVWDSKEKRLFCARDHVGIKPFFYHFQNGAFLFASEIKALFPLGVPKQPNEKIIFDYLYFGMYDHTKETFFQDIFTLPGGHALVLEEGKIRIFEYWNLANTRQDFSNMSEIEIKRKFTALLEDSIRMQFRSDVPVGINLSSGLDSNSLLYFAQSVLGFNVHTFSMCVPDEEYNECSLIETYITDEQKKLWHQCNITPQEVFPLAEKMIRIQDQPYGGIPTIAYANLNKEAKKEGITVLLEGQGLDEMLAGYDYYKFEYAKDRGERNQQNSFDVSQDMTRLTYNSILASEFVAQHNTQPLEFNKPFDSHLLNAQYRDLLYTKLPRVLRFNDHVSMAYHRELRVPFLDYRLIEFCFWLPVEYKINVNGQKILMREVMKEYLPDVVSLKSKKAFGAVQTKWLRNLFSKEIYAILESNSFKNRPYWNYSELMKQVADFYKGEGTNSFFLWQCINLELWFREFIDAPV